MSRMCSQGNPCPECLAELQAIRQCPSCGLEYTGFRREQLITLNPDECGDAVYALNAWADRLDDIAKNRGGTFSNTARDLRLLANRLAVQLESYYKG